MLLIRNREGSEVAPAPVLSLKPTTFKRRTEASKTFEKMHSGIISMKILMNQSNVFTVFFI